MPPMNSNGHVLLEVGPRGRKAAHSLQLPLNPDMSLSHDLRVTILQGPRTINVENYGLGVPTLTLSGTTAWQSPYGRYQGQPVNGEAAARHLYRDILQFFFQNPKNSLMIYSDVTEEAWDVVPTGAIQLQRTSQQPLLVYYTQQFIVLRDLITGYLSQPINDPLTQTLGSSKGRTGAATSTAQGSANTAQGVRVKATTVYVVQSGDTLWSIAQLFLPQGASNAKIQTAVDEIAQKNRLSNPSLIFPDERLTIPYPL